MPLKCVYSVLLKCIIEENVEEKNLRGRSRLEFVQQIIITSQMYISYVQVNIENQTIEKSGRRLQINLRIDNEITRMRETNILEIRKENQILYKTTLSSITIYVALFQYIFLFCYFNNYFFTNHKICLNTRQMVNV